MRFRPPQTIFQVDFPDGPRRRNDDLCSADRSSFEISIRGCTIKSMITAAAWHGMRLRPGDTVAALSKSPSVMIARIDSGR
jgi:molybdopterin-binding protein